MSNYKRFLIYFIGSFSLLLGLVLNENSSGGAKIDFEYLFPYIEGFSVNLSDGLNFYIRDSASIIHSPVFYVVISSIYKFINNVVVIKIIYIFLCSFLPFIFFLILKDKFNLEKNILFFFSLIIFISPYFRSSAIWLLGDNLSLIFFGLSIFYFNKINQLKKNDFMNCFLCLFFLILCCYVRYYYCLFSLYYLFFCYQNLQKKYFIILIFILTLISLPAFLYFYYIFFNFNFATTVNNYSQINFYNNSLVVLSILLFYLLPFCFIQKDHFLEYFRNNKMMIMNFFIIIFIFFILSQFIFTELTNFSQKGGGVFMKIAKLIDISPTFILSVTSFISLVFFDYFFQKKRIINYTLLIMLILSFPIFTIYQKYFDPLFFLFFFGLIRFNNIDCNFFMKKNFLFIVFTYFSFFYLFSLIYYSERFF